MQTITTPITLSELKIIAKNRFGTLVKAVVDIKKEIMVIDASLHADEEAELLAQGSNQANVWGINVYPELPQAEMIEFDSMINLRPSAGNMTRGIEDIAIQNKIRTIVQKLILL